MTHKDDSLQALTKRELFAAMAMQGLLAAGAGSGLIDDAVEMADALIEELSKPK